MRNKLFKISTLAILTSLFMNTSVYAMKSGEEEKPSRPAALASLHHEAFESLSLDQTSQKTLTHLRINSFLSFIQGQTFEPDIKLAVSEEFWIGGIEVGKEVCVADIKSHAESLTPTKRAEFEEALATPRTISPSKTKLRLFLPDGNYVEVGAEGGLVSLARPIDTTKTKTMIFAGHPYFHQELDFTKMVEKPNGWVSGRLQIGFTQGRPIECYIDGNLFNVLKKTTHNVCADAPLASEITSPTLGVNITRAQFPDNRFFAVGTL